MSEHKQNFPTETVQEVRVSRSTDSRILTEQSLRVVHFHEESQNGMELTDERFVTLRILRLHKLAKKLLEATEENFYVNSPLSRFWLNQVQLPVTFAECLLQHKFSPYAELYSKFFANITKDPTWNNNSRDRLIATRRLNLIKNKAIAMREAFESADFKKIIKGAQRSVNKNHQSLLEYLHALFNRDKTLLVLRLNLGYCEDEYIRQYGRSIMAGHNGLNPLSNTDANPSIPSNRLLMPCQLQGFSLQDVILHREELIRYLRTTLKQKLRGYIWKIEYTQYKGYQYHLVILLDATLAQTELPYERTIGKHWEDVITQGHGLCYSHAENKASYRFCATGVKNQADPDLPDDLAKVADYLTRPDLYIKLVLPDNQRTLNKGGLSAKKDSKKKNVRHAKPSTPSPSTTHKSN